MAEKKFKIKTNYKAAGDQPQAISDLVKSIRAGNRHQTLLGVTGSGKTFSVANVIEQIQKPTLVIAHNKTLAAQLTQEFREFFPENSVHYFVSYYDYYQPEAYLPTTDTYIEKEAMINEEIERLRHASTQALLSRKDVIIVASVSCIYGLGSPDEYEKVNFKITKGLKISRNDFIRKLVSIYYTRTNADLEPGTFRGVGQKIELMPVSEKFIVRFSFEGDQILNIEKIDSVTRSITEQDIETFFVFPAKHFVTDKEQVKVAIKTIESELKDRLKELEKQGKVLEHERIKRRTKYDLAMIKEVGYCNGIENYSRHFSGKLPGEAPDTLLSYFPHKSNGEPDFLTVIDESHVTVPQLNAMFAGDQSRKNTLVEHGFRLPSAKDNRPLKFNEFQERVGQVLYTTATPSKYEREVSAVIAEQVIRPTGLTDPEVEVKPITSGKYLNKKYDGQVNDFIQQSEIEIKKGGRVLGTTLTKKMAEDLTSFLKEKGFKTAYIHSDIKTIERIEILTEFRKGTYDIVIGVNLLREGLDLPEVTLIGIFDADKEGFLRSETSLIQTIGRAARNSCGRVILYADQVTDSMKTAMDETERRRKIQTEYNKKNGITPQTIKKAIKDITEHLKSDHDKAVQTLLAIDEKSFIKNPDKILKHKIKQMNAAAKILDYETAAILRDEIKQLEDRLEKSKK